MAYFDEKSGEVLLSSEDREALKEGLGKNWAENIMNWIIYGKRNTQKTD